MRDGEAGPRPRRVGSYTKTGWWAPEIASSVGCGSGLDERGPQRNRSVCVRLFRQGESLALMIRVSANGRVAGSARSVVDLKSAFRSARGDKTGTSGLCATSKLRPICLPRISTLSCFSRSFNFPKTDLLDRNESFGLRTEARLRSRSFVSAGSHWQPARGPQRLLAQSPAGNYPNALAAYHRSG
jgi:hypothetical protein